MNVFSFQYDVGGGLFDTSILHQQDTILPYLSLPLFLNHEGTLSFIKHFFKNIYWDDNVIFIHFAGMMNYIHWFAYIEPSMHLWGKSSRIVVNDLSDVLSDMVLLIFTYELLHV